MVYRQKLQEVKKNIKSHNKKSIVCLFALGGNKTNAQKKYAHPETRMAKLLFYKNTLTKI
jgi:hypothetical protein